MLKLAALAAGSWRFWAGTALAAGIVGGVALAVYKTVWAEPGDAGSYAYYDLLADPTAPAERIMTFNRIKTSMKGQVDYDNFNGSTTPTKTNRNWWEMLNEDGVLLDDYNLQDGTHFTCHAKGDDGPVLWEFINCRGGNLNPQDEDATPRNYQNCLPWSDAAYAFNSRVRTANQTSAGTLVMQNTPDAQVMSSCLKDGIGTIYFDAVNGFTGYQLARLQVEVAYGVWKTNATGRIEKPEGERKVPDDLEIAADGSFVPPDAAHADEHHTVDEGAETKTVETNVNARIAWVPVRTTGHWWCNGDDRPVAYTNTVVSLKMPEKTGTITDHFANFYRFWAPVQDERINPDLAPYCRCPMRFRIKRNDNPTAEHGNMGLDGEKYIGRPEENGLIILDNILASFPAMSLCAVPGGDYIEGGSSRNVIGWTGVFHPAGRSGKYYPKMGEKDLAVEAGIAFATNAPPGVTSDWIADTEVKMRHWIRYLDYVSVTNETTMTVGADGRLHGSVEKLPDMPGDLEYSYDAKLNAPYYGYVDYTGKNAGTPGYTERIAHVTSRLNPAAIPEGGLPSTGTDFFTRLREGKSDQLEYRLEVRWKDGLEYAVTNSPFYLSADGNWRTFVKVSTNATNVTAFRPGEYEFRIVGLDPAVAYVGDAETVGAIPWSGQGLRLQDAENPDGDWTAITFDGVTDALLFQLVEGSGAAPTYTIVHGSYQDFNQWTTRDSTLVPPLYVGAFAEGRGEMSGSSPDTRDFPCELPGWLPPSADNRDFWTESFKLSGTEKPIDGWGGYRAYEPFALCTTRQGWEAIGGMWVCSKWRESAAGGEMALQLGGGREGSLAFTNAKRLPHGIDQVAVRARVAEGADFGGFAIYDTGDSAANRNYIVSMRAVMRLNKTTDDFDGNGTVSIIGYYRSGRGCYEMRAERIATDTIRMNLYKWTFENGKAKATHLGYHRNTLAMNNQSYLRMNNADIPTSTSTSSYYGELFMRCQTSADEKTVTITAGLMNGAKKLSDSCSNVSHYYLVYKDTSSPITYGKCGFDALNCPAQIVDYAKYPDGGTFPSVSSKPYDPDGKEIPDANFRCGNGTVVYPSDRAKLFAPTKEGDDDFYENWSYRFDKFTLKGNFASEYRGLLTNPPTGELELYETHYDATERKDIERWVTNSVVRGFTYTNCLLTVRNTEDSSLRISTAKGSGDIVVDSASFDQWCAASYSDTDAHEFDARKSVACPENYVYLNGTVVSNADEHIIRLQPMRARTDVVSIRAPLMDGGNDDRYGAKEMQRGLGLGLLSYTYRNADANCIIIAQYKEIDGSNALKNPTDSSEGWIDVATNDFSTVTPEARRIGETVVVPFAKLGKKGVMRLVLAPWLVADAQDKAKNPKGDPNWGSVEIVDFTSRDDPPVDASCWWGWNLRTTNAKSERSLYDSKPADVGMALALNEAVDKDVIAETKDLYPQHLPFVQSPNFATNVAGEISFRARRLPGAAADEYTEVAILGAKDGGAADADWQFLTNILVKSDVYERYTYKTRANDGDFAAFRLAVIGVKNLNDGVPNYKDRMAIPVPRRVLIDEVEVTEAIRGRIRLIGVGAFKEPLEKHVFVTNLEEVVQQPMCGESWSVQCEVKKVQLPEEVVLDDATEVYFHWFTTNTSALAANWGWEKWKDKGKSAKLARIKDQPGFVYRGSYPEAGAAIVDPEKTAGTVVQYMLEVRYRNADGSEAAPYFMPTGDWDKPTWYNGVDYNRSYGAGERFAAFTILDSVPYGYAYINEVNLFDNAAKGTTDTANISNQYVEVAVPVGTDITGWELQFITGGIGEGSPFFTNTVVVYTDRDRYPGVGVPGKKTKWETDGYVFITAGNTATASGRLKSEEYVDGAWKVNEGEDHGPQILNDAAGTIDGGYPLGIRLKRPSGIVEHEIVIAGTNRYAAWGPSYELRADPTNFVSKLRRQLGGSWYWTGNDTGDVPGNGRSVTAFDGVVTNGSVWAHWQKTPGEINRNGAEREVMPSFVPKPLSTMLMLMAKLVGEHFDQTICDYRNVTNDVVVYVPKGIGTNITYRVDDWYGVVKITEQEAGKAKREYVPENPVGGYVRFEAAKDMSNDVTVVATSGLRRDLTERYGLGPENRYTDAIMAWLAKGKWGKGGTGTFKVPGGEIKPATFEGISGTVVRDLELEEMYWLDMDPTRGDLVLRAGMVTPPEKVVVKAPHIGPGQPGEVEYDREDIRLGVLMEISSRTGEFEPYAPYTLNGLKPESSSAVDARNWNAVTFKIEGYLANGRDDFKEPDRVWVPLRHFVFDGESFDATTHEALIQVRDPFLMEDWKPYEDKAVYFRWNLNDNRIGAMGSETLRPDSTFHE